MLSVVWSDVTLNFIEGQPKVDDKSTILIVVNRFSKYIHFIPLAHPYTAEIVIGFFFAEVVCLQGIPASIISDRDLIFMLAF